MINSTLSESSTIKFQVQLTEAWIQKLADEKDLIVSLSEQYQLHHFQVKLEPGTIIVEAELLNKPDSSVKVTCEPLWMVDEQQIQLENLEIKTKSRNLLVKSAGWVASTFLGEKIDRKMEEKVNQMINDYMEKFLGQPFIIPIKGHGQVTIKPGNLKIVQVNIDQGNATFLVEFTGAMNIELDDSQHLNT
jgi:hypothetical protein